MKFVRRKKPCKFCDDKSRKIDYKEPATLRRFVTDQGKIIPSSVTGTCSRHQRALTKAIKRARNIALMPYHLDVTQ